jgi:hypothetical protein
VTGSPKEKPPGISIAGGASGAAGAATPAKALVCAPLASPPVEPLPLVERIVPETDSPETSTEPPPTAVPEKLAPALTLTLPPPRAVIATFWLA